MGYKEAEETPEMEAEEHSKGFLKKAARMASGRKSGKKKKKATHKRVSKR